ncbi:MAG: hypothetical protein ACXWV4_00335 [Flavitalea sp.]
MKTHVQTENDHTTGNIVLRVGITGAALLICMFTIVKFFATALSVL